MRILVVDSNSHDLNKLVALLARFGTCDAVGNGHEALAKFVKAIEDGRPYQLIAVDMNLSEMTCQEILAKVREWESEPLFADTIRPAKVVLLTTSLNESLAIESGQAGQVGHLLKPFTQESLNKVLAAFFPPRQMLIVDGSLPDAEQLRSALAGLGQAQIVESGSQALAEIQQAIQAGQPFDLIFSEYHLPDMSGGQLIQSIRQQEQTGGGTDAAGSATIILVTADTDREVLAACLKQGCSECLKKPVDYGKLEVVLGRVGIELIPPSVKIGESEAHAPLTTDATAVTMIQNLLQSGSGMNDNDFRVRLEKILNEAGMGPLEFLNQRLFSGELNLKTKLNIVRVYGYLHKVEMLDPLKRLIDEGGNFFLTKESIIAVTKYNERKALGILSTCLTKITDQSLIDQISAAVARIRKDDPIMALLPRFINEYQKPIFRSIVETFKRVLTPADSCLFIDYLHNPAPALANGAFDILTSTADESAFPILWGYFQNHFNRLRQNVGANVGELTRLTTQIGRYFKRYPQFALGSLSEIAELYPKTTNRSFQAAILQILTISRDPSVISMLQNVYEAEIPLRETILIGWVSNPAAQNFLFEKFQTDKILKNTIARLLAQSESGIEFLTHNFFSFGPPDQEVIMRYLDFQAHKLAQELLTRILSAKESSVKTTVLTKIGPVLTGPIRTLLTDPDHEEEFFSLGEAFFTAARTSFPLRLVSRILNRIAKTPVDFIHLRLWFATVLDILQYEAVLAFPSGDIFEPIAGTMIKAGDSSANQAFLRVLTRLNTFCPATLADVQRGINAFVQQRGDRLNDEEDALVKQARDNLQRLQKEMETVAQFEKDFVSMLSRQVISPEQLDHLLSTNRLAAALRFDRLTTLLAAQMSGVSERVTKITRLLARYPKLQLRVNAAQSAGQEGEAKKKDEPAAVPGAESPSIKIVCNFIDKKTTALFMDQIQGILPDFTFTYDQENLEGCDLLIADTTFLDRFVDPATLGVRKIFLMLDDPNDFRRYQAFNPKALVAPVSLYKALKLMLPEAYFG